MTVAPAVESGRNLLLRQYQRRPAALRCVALRCAAHAIGQEIEQGAATDDAVDEEARGNRARAYPDKFDTDRPVHIEEKQTQSADERLR